MANVLTQFSKHDERMRQIGGNDSLSAVQAYAQHATIFWRVPTQRIAALQYLDRAERLVIGEQGFEEHDNVRDAKVALCMALAQMGQFERLREHFGCLNQNQRVRVSAAVFLNHWNWKSGRGREGDVVWYLESDEFLESLK